MPPVIPSTSQLIAAPVPTQSEAANVCVWPSETLAVVGKIRFAHVMLTSAAPLFAESATLAAVIVTVDGDGGATGAVYVAESPPFAVIVPTTLLPPAIPFTVHVTPVAGLPEAATAAVKTCVPPAETLAEGGETPTTMSSRRATLAGAESVESTALTAVIDTAGFAGRMAGAV